MHKYIINKLRQWTKDILKRESKISVSNLILLVKNCFEGKLKNLTKAVSFNAARVSEKQSISLAVV